MPRKKIFKTILIAAILLVMLVLIITITLYSIHWMKSSNVLLEDVLLIFVAIPFILFSLLWGNTWAFFQRPWFVTITISILPMLILLGFIVYKHQYNPKLSIYKVAVQWVLIAYIVALILPFITQLFFIKNNYSSPGRVYRYICENIHWLEYGAVEPYNSDEIGLKSCFESTE